MVCKWMLALSAVAVSLVSVSARADGLPMLADANPNQIGIIVTGAGASTNPQVYTASYGNFSFGASGASAPLTATGPVQVTSSVYGGNDPSVSASAVLSGTGALYAGGYLTVESYLQYTFEVSGPAGGFAPVDISTAGGASQSGPGTSGALAELTIEQAGGTASNSVFRVMETAAVGTLVPTGPFGQSSGVLPQFSLEQMYMLADNTPYTVILAAAAQSFSVNGPFTASAFVDPTIQLDATASVEDHLYFSPDLGASDSTGVTPVPEPSGLTLLGTGALGLAGMVRRQLRGF